MKFSSTILLTITASLVAFNSCVAAWTPAELLQIEKLLKATAIYEASQLRVKSMTDAVAAQSIIVNNATANVAKTNTSVANAQTDLDNAKKNSVIATSFNLAMSNYMKAAVAYGSTNTYALKTEANCIPCNKITSDALFMKYREAFNKLRSVSGPTVAEAQKVLDAAKAAFASAQTTLKKAEDALDVAKKNLDLANTDNKLIEELVIAKAKCLPTQASKDYQNSVQAAKLAYDEWQASIKKTIDDLNAANTANTTLINANATLLATKKKIFIVTSSKITLVKEVGNLLAGTDGTTYEKSCPVGDAFNKLNKAYLTAFNAIQTALKAADKTAANALCKTSLSDAKAKQAAYIASQKAQVAKEAKYKAAEEEVKKALKDLLADPI